MSFRLRQDTENWFSKISPQMPSHTKFDVFYLCLMLGLAMGRKSDPLGSGQPAPEFVTYFVENFKQSQRLIIGLLIVRELSRLSRDSANKEDVRRLIGELVEPESATNLTDLGHRLMNEYASGGYDYLTEALDSKPHHIEEFLQTYEKLLRQGIDEAGE